MNKAEMQFINKVDIQEVDQELRDLIKTMNQVPWLQTTSCCWGHDEPTHENFYVQFFLKSSGLSTLCEILNKVAHGRTFPELSVVLSDEWLCIYPKAAYEKIQNILKASCIQLRKNNEEDE